MATLFPIVLVHGAWSNASAWSATIDALHAVGAVSVTAPDLPGHGADTTSVPEITLDTYVDRVVEAMRSFDQPALLVGHSMAGTLISEVAERSPGAVRHLVYLSAFLLPDGQSLYGFTQTSPGMAESGLGAALRPGDGVLGVDDAQFIEVFCADAEPGIAKLALASNRPEPLSPLGTPIHVTAAAWGSVPRTYIRTTRDRCVSPTSQNEMFTDVGVDRVIDLDASHLAMLTKPVELAHIIAELANAGSSSV